MISQDELNQRPMTTTLVPMYAVDKPEVFAFMGRFPCGLNQVWTITAPDTPIDDDWLREALRTILEMVIADLRDGRNEPRVKRNRVAFHETNWESVTGALHKLLVDWARKRVEWARAMATPSTIQ